MKKALSFFLVLVMMVSLIPSVLAEDAPIVVTMCLNHSSDLDDGKWYKSNEIRMLRELYNIDLQYQYYDAEQYAMLFASADFPDIMTCNKDYLDTVRDNGYALNLDEHKDLLPNVFSDTYTATNELSRAMLGGEKKELLFLFPCIGPEDTNCDDNTSWGIRLRWDLYKQLGCPEIKSADDWIEVMKQMVAMNPTTPSGEKVYGIGTWNAFSRFYQTGCMLIDGGNLNPWVYGGTMYMSGWDDCVLYNGYTNMERSAYWNAMKFFNKCWREGLFDEESFYMTSDQLKAKVRAGRYVSAVPYEGKELYAELSKDDPNTITAIVNIGSNAAFCFANKPQLTGNAPSDNIFINKNCKNLEATLTVLNFFSDPDIVRTCFNGIKGVDWDYDENGVPHLTEKALNDIQTYGANTDAYYENTGIYGGFSEWTRFTSTGIHPDGYTYDLSRTYEVRALTLNSWQKDFAAAHGVTCPSEYYMQQVEAGLVNDLSGDYGQMVALGINDIPMDIKRIMDECASIAERAMPELIMAKTDEEFAEIQNRLLTEWEEADEPEAWAWCENAFNEAKAVVQPAFEMYQQSRK